MSNPFKYGTVVSGEDFANRDKELRELASRLKETVRIFLVAPRRYGKTSLIKNKSMPQIYLSKEERRQDIKQTDVCFDISMKKT